MDHTKSDSLRTLVLGASTNPARYSYKAAVRLMEAGHEVLLVGGGKADLSGQPIHQGTGRLDFEGVDTVTMYLSVAHQALYTEALLRLKPRRVIFNPGSENPDLMRLLRKVGVEVQAACTLVLLSMNSYAG